MRKKGIQIFGDESVVFFSSFEREGKGKERRELGGGGQMPKKRR